MASSSSSATRSTLLALALPIVLMLVVINMTWFTVQLTPGVTQLTEIHATGSQGTVFVAILLACAALAVVFFIANKGVRYALSGLQLVFAALIVYSTLNYLADPMKGVRPELEKISGLTGEHAFDNMIESSLISFWPYIMFVVAGLMLVSVIVMFRLIRVMPQPTKKYERAEKPSHEDSWGVADEPEED